MIIKIDNFTSLVQVGGHLYHLDWRGSGVLSLGLLSHLGLRLMYHLIHTDLIFIDFGVELGLVLSAFLSHRLLSLCRQSTACGI